jgi:RND family efflux transporter MFP subunit
VDIGDRVSAGQLLAEIDSPELDQQIREAQAGVRRSESMERQSGHMVEQARANRELARVTNERWSLLVAKGVLAKQEGDEKRSAYVARQADVAAAESGLASATEALAASQAALGRLREMQQFRKVVAPFAGVITARNIEVGSLVGAGSSSAVRELFRIADLSVLKVQVSVPQSEVQLIRVGSSIDVTVDELPRQSFAGRVVRTASTLDPASRTLLTEVSLSNPGGRLLPGMYASLVFHLRRPDPPVLVPATALLLGAQGTRLAVVGQGGRIHYQPVTVGRDYGTQVEIVSGIAAGQKVVMNVTGEMPEGTPVKPVPLATKIAPGISAGTPKGGAL